MERWHNKVAVVTGASSGIGAAIVEDLLRCGLQVVGLARRVQRIEDIKSKLAPDLQTKLIALECDVSKLDSVNQAFNTIISLYGGVDILINNAGCMTQGKLCTAKPEDIQRVLQTNVMGVVFCTQRAFESMRERQFDGHVVLLNSISGHRVRCIPNYTPDNNIYAPSKFALTAITEIYRQEFKGLGTKVKVTSISPGATETEIIPESMKHSIVAMLRPQDISQSIVYVLSTPPHVQIHEMTIKPVGEIF